MSAYCNRLTGSHGYYNRVVKVLPEVNGYCNRVVIIVNFHNHIDKALTKKVCNADLLTTVEKYIFQFV